MFPKLFVLPVIPNPQNGIGLSPLLAHPHCLCARERENDRQAIPSIN